jgi:glyoxylase-like metal-dependent hydrolase (beta-lactamase superfamily II)
MIRVGFRWLERGTCSHPEIMTLGGGSLCPVDFPSMVGVIEHPTRGIFLFDTGYDPAFKDATAPFPERFYRWTTPVQIDDAQSWHNWLRLNGIAEDAIAGTVISHFHGDHVAGMRHLADKPVFCAKAGLAELRKPGRIGRVRQGLLPQLVPATADHNAHFFEDAPTCALSAGYAPFAEGRDILGDGSLIAVELPGHCTGHWGMAFSTHDGQAVLLAADAVWSGRSISENRPPPRITTALLGNTRNYRATLNLLSSAARNNRELAILPSHCRASAMAFAKPDAS